MIALSGVRSSCDMLARNSDLWRSASSSWRLLSPISRKRRAFWIATADWLAKVLRRSMTAGENYPVVLLVDRAPVGARDLGGAGHDRVEHDFEVEGGAEDLAHLAQRLKLRDRAGERLGPGLELGEQSGVLDRDGGLVGKGLHQRDLAVGEEPDVMSVDGDDAQ